MRDEESEEGGREEGRKAGGEKGEESEEGGKAGGEGGEGGEGGKRITYMQLL